MKKLFLLAGYMIISTTSKSQVFVDFGGGVSRVTKSLTLPIIKISVGYKISNIVTEGILQPSITRISNTPSYFGVKEGYNIHGFIPSVGILYDYRSSDNINENSFEIGYALKYQYIVTDNGGLYSEVMYTKSSLSLTLGFNIQF